MSQKCSSWNILLSNYHFCLYKFLNSWIIQGCIFFQISFIYPTLMIFLLQRSLSFYAFVICMTNIFVPYLSLTKLQVLCKIYIPASNNFIICLLFALNQGQNLKVLCINHGFLLNFSNFITIYKRGFTWGF